MLTPYRSALRDSTCNADRLIQEALKWAVEIPYRFLEDQGLVVRNWRGLVGVNVTEGSAGL